MKSESSIGPQPAPGEIERMESDFEAEQYLASQAEANSMAITPEALQAGISQEDWEQAIKLSENGSFAFRDALASLIGKAKVARWEEIAAAQVKALESAEPTWRQIAKEKWAPADQRREVAAQVREVSQSFGNPRVEPRAAGNDELLELLKDTSKTEPHTPTDQQAA